MPVCVRTARFSRRHSVSGDEADISKGSWQFDSPSGDIVWCTDLLFLMNENKSSRVSPSFTG